MKVLVTGAGGQLGRELVRLAPPQAEVRAVDRADLDISDAAAVAQIVGQVAPAVIINAAAYTAVDKAEQEPSAALRVNAEGARLLARAAHALQVCRMVQVSTDYIFDGSSSRPYRPGHAPHPLGVYGRSKLEGEQAVLDALGPRAIIVRTSWVYAAHGRNFLHTMLRLMRERGAVRVVADQIGTPTSAHGLAEALWQFAKRPGLAGVFHWTDAGVASWYDFAVAIAEEAAALGLLPAGVQVTPIATEDFPTPARRPAYSVLDKGNTAAALAVEPRHWRQRLREVLKEVAHG
jgi:dTDP-4-dehydrorhamnose reductase